MKNEDFIKMSSKDFDLYMVNKYPKLFRQRHLPMTETCMCWGFEVGKGWYKTLDDLCSKIEALCDVCPINIEFTQIKEKYGSGRFYFDSWHNEDVSDEELPKALSVLKIIDDLISKAENDVNYICAETGEKYYNKYSSGGWIYDVDPKVLIKLNPERYKEDIEKWFQKRNISDDIKDVLMNFDLEELNKIKEFINSLK
jgi:hypothetical protein